MLFRLTAIFVSAAIVASACAQWTSFHGGPQRHGRANRTGPASPVLRWALDLNGPAVQSPIVAPDGTIYLGPLWDESQKKPRSYFYAIDPSGTIRWKFEIQYRDSQQTTAPTLDDSGNVYFGDAWGTIRSLDPQGNLRWQKESTQPILANMVVNGNRLYGIQDGNLLSIDVANGATVWQFPLGQHFPGGPTILLDGSIVVSSSTGLVAVTAAGAERWRSWMGGFYPSAVAPDGTILTTGYFLSSINPNTGVENWFENTGNSVNPDVTPTVDAQGNFYFMKSWSVTKYNPQGVEVWSHLLNTSNFLGDAHTSFVLDTANRLYVAAGWYKRAAIAIEKNVHCFNAATGALIWSYPLPEIPSPSSPALGPDGTLYVGCTDGKLYAIGGPTLRGDDSKTGDKGPRR